MAKPSCTFCETNEGVYMGTNLSDGDTQVACGPCLPSFALGMAAAMTSGMSPELAGEYADAFDAVAANDPRPPKPPAATGGRRKPAAKTSDPPAASTGAPETATVPLPDGCPECHGPTATGDAVKLVCDTCGHVIASVDEQTG